MLLYVACQDTALVLSSSVLPAVDLSVATITLFAHLISICTHFSTVPLTKKNESLSPGSILHFKNFRWHLAPLYTEVSEFHGCKGILCMQLAHH